MIFQFGFSPGLTDGGGRDRMLYFAADPLPLDVKECRGAGDHELQAT